MELAKVAYLPGTTAPDPATRDLRGVIRDALESDRDLTQAKIARESGVSATRVSQWLAGSYAGDNEAVEQMLQRWLDTRVARREVMQTMPRAPDYVATPSAELVYRTLRFAQYAGDVSVIYGAAGVGKTAALHYFAAQSPSVFVATMTPASAGVVPALEEIALSVDASSAAGGAAKLHRAIVARLRGTNGLLAIDEAQHLSVPALDQVRAIHDACGVGLALLGNETVFTRMTGGNRAATYDRLFSRIGKRVRLGQASAQDARAMADAWGVTDPASRTLLADIAAQPGALRTVTKVLRVAGMSAGAGTAPSIDAIRAAWSELGGA